jgi:hypothetical protein
MHSTVAAALGSLVLAVFLLGSGAFAHEGEDHGPADRARPQAAAAPRAEAVSDQFELVAVARRGELTIFLDRVATNAPVADAKISVETPSGSVDAVAAADETYRLAAPWSRAPGRYDLIVTVVAEGAADVLTLTLTVPDRSPASAPASTSLLSSAAVAGGFTNRIARNDLFALATGIAGFLLGVGTAMLARRRSRAAALGLALLAAGSLAAAPDPAFAHEGDDHGAPAAAIQSDERDLAQRLPDGAVFVPKATQRILAIRTSVTEAASHRRTIELPGRIIADPNASGYVQASLAGRVSAPEKGFPGLGTRVSKGEVVAYVTPPVQAIDASDMRQRQGELDQQISIVERRIARFEPLAQRGAITQVQLDEARLELQGLRDRRAALDRVRAEPEALAAPVSGVIAEASAVAGQIAQPNTVLFQIVDPTRLWVEALSFDPLNGIAAATARTSAGRSLALAYVGAGLADRNQAVPAHFKVEGDATGLRLGQFVTVLATTADERQGVALPRASIVRGANGQSLVFEHASAERFAPRPVRVEPLDGERVLIAAGLSPKTRVVTQGAELLDQVR